MSDESRIDELRRRLEADPGSIIFAALAEECRRAGRFHEAIETCRAGLARHPGYLSARVTLGRALIAVGEIAEARAALTEVLKAAPENLAAIRALADIHDQDGGEPPPSGIDDGGGLGSYGSLPALGAFVPEIQGQTPGPTPPPPPAEPTVALRPPPFATPTPVAPPQPDPFLPPKWGRGAEDVSSPTLRALEQLLHGIDAVKAARVGRSL